MYKTIDEWLDEIENYSTRRERIPAEAMVWVRTAWEWGYAAGWRLGREAGIEWCAQVDADNS